MPDENTRPQDIDPSARHAAPDAEPQAHQAASETETPSARVHPDADPPARDPDPDADPDADPDTEPIPAGRPELDMAYESARRFARIGGRPEPDTLPGKWDPGRFLRRFAGVDERLIAWVPQERARYTGMGGAVLFTSLMAFVSMTAALSIAFDTRSPVILLLSGLWFLLILNFDRWLVSAPLPERGTMRATTILARSAMAFVFGIVIAEPLVLVVFDSAVQQKVQEVRAEELKAYEGKWLACNPDPQTGVGAQPATDPAPSASASTTSTPTGGLDCTDFPGPPLNNITQLVASRNQLATQLGGVESQLALLTPQHQALVQAAVNDCNGATGHYGLGPVCRQLTALADQFKATHQLDQLSNKAGELRAQIQALNDEIPQQSAEWGKQRDAHIAEKVAEWSQGRGDVGLLERIEALNLLAAKHLSLLFGIWAVRLLFILVDLAPALLKFTSGRTTYDRLVAADNRLGELLRGARRAEEQADAQAWAEDYHEDLAVARARLRALRTAEYESIMDDLDARFDQAPSAASPTRSGQPTFTYLRRPGT